MGAPEELAPLNVFVTGPIRGLSANVPSILEQEGRLGIQRVWFTEGYSLQAYKLVSHM